MNPGILAASIRLVQRRWRRRLFQCTRCGYRLHQQGRDLRRECPKCGAVLRLVRTDG